MLFDCKICSMKFFTQDEFTDHMNIHDGKRPYKCFVCEKEFCIAEHLQDHVRLHAEASSRLRREEGDDEYQRRAELMSHSAIHAWKHTAVLLNLHSLSIMKVITQYCIIVIITITITIIIIIIIIVITII